MGEWDTSPEPRGKTVLRFPVPSGDPRQIYGFYSQSTRLCIEALVGRSGAAGLSFMDFGTGSGILAAVAHLLGYGPIFATELHPEARAFALEFWALNNIPITLLDREPDELPVVDVCVANIGDRLWDVRFEGTQKMIHAKELIYVTDAGQLREYVDVDA